MPLRSTTRHENRFQYFIFSSPQSSSPEERRVAKDPSTLRERVRGYAESILESNNGTDYSG
jgi:hypothetical protein